MGVGKKADAGLGNLALWLRRQTQAGDGILRHPRFQMGFGHPRPPLEPPDLHPDQQHVIFVFLHSPTCLPLLFRYVSGRLGKFESHPAHIQVVMVATYHFITRNIILSESTTFPVADMEISHVDLVQRGSALGN